jgi:hypothetical protein
LSCLEDAVALPTASSWLPSRFCSAELTHVPTVCPTTLRPPTLLSNGPFGTVSDVMVSWLGRVCKGAYPLHVPAAYETITSEKWVLTL